MPKDIQKVIERLTIQSKEKKEKKPPTQRPAYKKEHWIYGFHLKNRKLRRISEEYSLPWKTNPIRALSRIQGHMAATTRLPCTFHGIQYRGKPAKFIVFMEDDGRKRLHLNKFTESQMDAVRAAMFLPEGTKPKWYDYCGEYVDERDLSSEDEDMPPLNLPESAPISSLSEIPTRRQEDDETSDMLDDDIFSDSDSYYETNENEPD